MTTERRDMLLQLALRLWFVHHFTDLKKNSRYLLLANNDQNITTTELLLQCQQDLLGLEIGLTRYLLSNPALISVGFALPFSSITHFYLPVPTTAKVITNILTMVTVCNSISALNSALEAAGDKLVMIDFYAVWCGPCKMIAPRIEAWVKEFPEVVFIKVDVDQNQEAAEKYGITAMPTFKFIRNKAEVSEFVGASPNDLHTKILTLKG